MSKNMAKRYRKTAMGKRPVSPKQAMGGRRSRNKGSRGEREWRDFLKAMGYPSERGQQRSGGADSPDVKGGIPGTHVEVKRVELFRMWDALKQAREDAGDGAVPYVATRRNNEEWVVVIEARFLRPFAEAIAGSREWADLLE